MKPTKEEMLEVIAKDYHKACDDYDSNTLTLLNKYWETMPDNASQARATNQYAKIQRDKAYQKWEILGLTKREVMSAIQQIHTRYL